MFWMYTCMHKYMRFCFAYFWVIICCFYSYYFFLWFIVSVCIFFGLNNFSTHALLLSEYFLVSFVKRQHAWANKCFAFCVIVILFTPERAFDWGWESCSKQSCQEPCNSYIISCSGIELNWVLDASVIITRTLFWLESNFNSYLCQYKIEILSVCFRPSAQVPQTQVPRKTRTQASLFLVKESLIKLQKSFCVCGCNANSPTEYGFKNVRFLPDFLSKPFWFHKSTIESRNDAFNQAFCPLASQLATVERRNSPVKYLVPFCATPRQFCTCKWSFPRIKMHLLFFWIYRRWAEGNDHVGIMVLSGWPELTIHTNLLIRICT